MYPQPLPWLLDVSRPRRPALVQPAARPNRVQRPAARGGRSIPAVEQRGWSADVGIVKAVSDQARMTRRSQHCNGGTNLSRPPFSFGYMSNNAGISYSSLPRTNVPVHRGRFILTSMNARTNSMLPSEKLVT